MCLPVYIMSGHELPIMARDKSQPGLSVETDSGGYLPIFFGHEFYYRVSCHMGCGCGFKRGRLPNWDDELGEIDEGDFPENIASRQALADFLQAALRSQTKVEVLIGYQGSPRELERPLNRRPARPADFSHFGLFESIDTEIVVVFGQDGEPTIVPALEGT